MIFNSWKIIYWKLKNNLPNLSNNVFSKINNINLVKNIHKIIKNKNISAPDKIW